MPSLHDRTRRFGLQLTEGELKLLKRIATEDGVSCSTVMRMALMKEMRSRWPTMTRADFEQAVQS